MHLFPHRVRILSAALGVVGAVIVVVAGLAVAKPFLQGQHTTKGHVSVLPPKGDSDRDGLRNWYELNRTRTNPRKADSDGDGLSDWTEVRRTTTNPRKADSDGDGANDGREIAAGSDPRNPSSVPSTPSSPPPTPNPPNPPNSTPPDPSPPTVTPEAIWTPPGTALVSLPVTLDGTSSTGGDPLACTWSFENQDGSKVFQTLNGCKVTFTFTSTGTKHVKLTVEDAEGEADSNKQSFTVGTGSDTTPPNTTIGSGPSGTTTATGATFTFTSTETGSSFQCQLDGSGWGSCSSPQAYSGLGEGSHSFSVRATDGTGNTDPTPATRTWTVEGSTPPPPDTTPPNTTIVSSPPATTSSTSASFSFNSSEAGSSFECKLDSAAFVSCTSPRPHSGLALGQHTFSVRATDAAENTDPTPATWSWTVTEAPPPPPSGCVAGATQATTAAQVRSAVQGGNNVCVVADVGNVDLEGLGTRAVVISTNGGSMGQIDLNGTRNLTVRSARFRSADLWEADGTTIEGSTIGGTASSRTSSTLINVSVSTDVTIRNNEMAWTLAGSGGNSGYGIRSPGNSLGFNHRLRIEGNRIHHIAADGIQGFGNSQDVVVDRNEIAYISKEPSSSEHSDGIQVIDHGPNMRITNNWIHHEGFHDVGQSTGSSGTMYVHGGDNDTLLIENNLFSSSRGRVEICGLGTGGTSKSNLTIRRNTFLELGEQYNSFPGFEWDCDSGSNNTIERNIAQDPDGGFANSGSLAAASFLENLWRDGDTASALTFDAAGNCTSAACNPAGQEAIGFRKPSGVDW